MTRGLPARSAEPGSVGVREWPAPLLIGALVGSLVAGRFETALACLSIAALAAGAAGAGRPPGRWLGAVAIGMSIALGLNLYLTPGRPLPLPRLLGLQPTREGLRFGILLGLRLAGASAALHGLRAAWPGERAADELARLARPLEGLRVPVRESRAVVGLALRFVPLLVDEARRIAAIQELRAGRPPRGVREQLERRRARLVPALVSALERAEWTALALEARHYRMRPVAAGPRPPIAASGLGAGLAALSILWRG